jgi:hypothetical protein
MLARTPVLLGLCFGTAGVSFSLVFIAVSLFTGISREWWAVLNQAKGVLVFGLCAVAGFVAYRQCRSLKSGAVCGCVAGTLAGFLVPLFIYLVTYVFLDHVLTLDRRGEAFPSRAV